MQRDPYRLLTAELGKLGLTAQLRGADQLIVSVQQGPAWPDKGNGFWVSHKGGSWYICTWSPACDRVPPAKNIVALCSACMSFGESAMYRVPADIVARFELQEIDDREYHRLFAPSQGAD
jgi:hypothetical protein